ncbi:aminoacyl tRNA synthase complex-interacting multifunctional protein 1 [Selaginella moellendorffii]|nr:aminoacyl tRNA synthase complex-interacting multifunctional protein 1 [Selaginella moellendorffii]XP_024532230.1 aminoacyl tRNA synthase complex-interacting multifunctional protein 1 [Selaginella moellendorffii]XP_024532231.1 aminoacyl tRNA synthase complex-interacting multifunctional protein 1 [Selaginella moellendorffii]|eukprot:XP_002971404.2 aminoacyl tRNA synthase complex-interacting multifunctional protein 1 [Selaginella moellendorffii]
MAALGGASCIARHARLGLLAPAIRGRVSVKSRSICKIRGFFCSNSSSEVAPAPAPTESAAPVVESGARAAESEGNGVDALDIRVGRIVKAWKHPEADSLYVEEVDMAEESGPRTICSGLVNYVPEDELQGKLVAVLANLKPRNMKGVKSNGMLLAASDKAHENVELVIPPEGSVPGERIWFGSEDQKSSQAPAATPNQLQKKKLWEALQPKLTTGEDLVVYFEGQPMRTSAGVVTSRSLIGANVS